MQDLFPPIIHGPLLREQYLMLFGAAGAFGLVTGLIGTWIGAYVGARRGARREIARAGEKDTRAVEAGLSDLRQAVEAMAVEMERISEGQRFTARMLVERVPPAPAATHGRRDSGTVTPH